MISYRPNNAILLALSKACDIVFVTLVWAIACIPIITVGAATCARNTVLWRIECGQDMQVLPEFWGAFRANWRTATGAWLIMLAAGVVLTGDIMACARLQATSPALLMMRWVTVLFFVCYCSTLIYLFGGIAKFQVTIKQALRNAFLWGIGCWNWTVLLAGMALINIFFLYFLAWFSVPFVAFNFLLQSKITMRIFMRYVNQ